jgi:HlyD family secretion protein
MQVWAAVNEADIGEISVGQRVTFKVDAYRDETFVGRVSQIRLNAGLSNNVVTYGVVVTIDDVADKLLPYMTANLSFEVQRRQNTLLVPNQALRWQPALSQITPAVRDQLVADGSIGNDGEIKIITPTVWVEASDGFARPINVETGTSDGMVTELRGESLQEGDQIIVGTIRKKKMDFVSSFISKVVDTGGEDTSKK